MGRLNIEVVENATKTVNIMTETPLEKVVADCMKDYLEMRKDEEQGLILRLPCPIGTKAFYIMYGKNGWFISDYEFDVRDLLDFGNRIFLTKEEAEQALKQMGE